VPPPPFALLPSTPFPLWHHTMGFFSKQRHDYAGQLAVKLEKFIIFLFVLSVIRFGIHVHQMIVGRQFWAGQVLMINLTWLVLYAGFMGAYRRKTCLLMFFFVMCIVGALALIGGFMITSIGVSMSLINDCQQTPGCDANAEAVKDATVVTAAVFAFTIVPLILNVVGAVLALVTRREILIARAEAAAKQASMEEGGITIPAEQTEAKAKTADEPVPMQQQIQFAQMPGFIPAEGQLHADSQQSWPQGYPQPVVYYYYYPMPTQQQ